MRGLMGCYLVNAPDAAAPKYPAGPCLCDERIITAYRPIGKTIFGLLQASLHIAPGLPLKTSTPIGRTNRCHHRRRPCGSQSTMRSAPCSSASRRTAASTSASRAVSCGRSPPNRRPRRTATKTRLVPTSSLACGPTTTRSRRRARANPSNRSTAHPSGSGPTHRAHPVRQAYQAAVPSRAASSTPLSGDDARPSRTPDTKAWPAAAAASAANTNSAWRKRLMSTIQSLEHPFAAHHSPMSGKSRAPNQSAGRGFGVAIAGLLQWWHARTLLHRDRFPADTAGGAHTDGAPR